MTTGIGGATAEEALASLRDMTDDVQVIDHNEYRSRIANAQKLLREQGLDAMYLNAGTNLYYFTGTRWSASERMVGAIIPAQGPLHYLAPAFEMGTLQDFMQIEGQVSCWQEHQSPSQLFAELIRTLGIEHGTIGIDESTPFFIVDGLYKAAPHCNYVNAGPISAACRMHKSPGEIALMQRAKDMTLAVHRATATILRAGISAAEVTDFINRAHKTVGAAAGSYFCIVLFGPDTAFPHGVANPKSLGENEMVLIDTGCQVEAYISDITRSYVFGEPNPRHREIWRVEQEAQLAAFRAAQIGIPCGAVDEAARRVLRDNGFGPEYELPGLPHRTGHGIGLDIHEWPYLVRGDETPLATGMCFSNEPMLCVPGEFGVRHEDHFYMTDSGPRWFTQPAHSIDDPFGYQN